MEEKRVIKAGCILINLKRNEIGLVYRVKHDDFTFPKGHLEKGETLKECAIRETAEETKRDCEIVDDNPYVHNYRDSVGDLCECSYYIAIDKGHSNNTSEDTHELVWVKFDEVEDKKGRN